MLWKQRHTHSKNYVCETWFNQQHQQLLRSYVTTHVHTVLVLFCFVFHNNLMSYICVIISTLQVKKLRKELNYLVQELRIINV